MQKSLFYYECVSVDSDNADKAIDVWTAMQEEGVNSSDQFLVKLANYLKSKGIKPPFNISEETLKIYNKEGRRHSVQLEELQQTPAEKHRGRWSVEQQEVHVG